MFSSPLLTQIAGCLAEYVTSWELTPALCPSPLCRALLCSTAAKYTLPKPHTFQVVQLTLLVTNKTSLAGKSTGLGVRQTWLEYCVALDKLLGFSESLFLHLENWGNNTNALLR